MRTFLFKALVNNKPDFVDLFLEIGLPISSVIADGKFILNLHKEVLLVFRTFYVSHNVVMQYLVVKPFMVDALLQLVHSLGSTSIL